MDLFNQQQNSFYLFQFSFFGNNFVLWFTEYNITDHNQHIIYFLSFISYINMNTSFQFISYINEPIVMSVPLSMDRSSSH